MPLVETILLWYCLWANELRVCLHWTCILRLSGEEDSLEEWRDNPSGSSCPCLSSRLVYICVFVLSYNASVPLLICCKWRVLVHVCIYMYNTCARDIREQGVMCDNTDNTRNLYFTEDIFTDYKKIDCWAGGRQRLIISGQKSEPGLLEYWTPL